MYDPYYVIEETIPDATGGEHDIYNILWKKKHSEVETYAEVRAAFEGLLSTTTSHIACWYSSPDLVTMLMWRDPLNV